MGIKSIIRLKSVIPAKAGIPLRRAKAGFQLSPE
jgi:hypothetical protein